MSPTPRRSRHVRLLAIELSVLFIGISLLVGVLQRHIPPSKVEALLTSSGGSEAIFLLLV